MGLVVLTDDLEASRSEGRSVHKTTASPTLGLGRRLTTPIEQFHSHPVWLPLVCPRSGSDRPLADAAGLRASLRRMHVRLADARLCAQGGGLEPPRRKPEPKLRARVLTWEKVVDPRGSRKSNIRQVFDSRPNQQWLSRSGSALAG